VFQIRVRRNRNKSQRTIFINSLIINLLCETKNTVFPTEKGKHIVLKNNRMKIKSSFYRMWMREMVFFSFIQTKKCEIFAVKLIIVIESGVKLFV
jgi:exopolysaccharide biosynthesis predicted pyruvyltransferase EpsI